MEKEIGKKSSYVFFGVALAFIAPMFLFNPEWSIIDIAPDFIGYFLIVLSLYRLRDLNSFFESAASSFVKATIVSAIRFASIFVLALLNEKERPTMTLLLMFIFDVGELIILIPAWKAYFEGFSFLGFDYTGKKGRSYAEKITKSTIVFIIAKQIVTFLPELSVLSSQRYVDQGEIEWDKFTSMFRTLAVATMLVWGIVWFCKMLKFLGKTAKQKLVFDEAQCYYRTNVVKRVGTFELRRISLVLILFVIAMIFFMDLYVDGVGLLPDFAGAVFFICFFIFSRYSGKLRIPGIVTSALYFGMSIYAEIRYSGFKTGNSLALVRVEPDDWNAFWAYYPFRVIETCLLAVILVFVTVTLKSIINNHCGYVPDEISEAYRQKRIAEINRVTNSWLAVFAVFAFLGVSLGGAGEYLQTFKDNMFLSGANVWAFFAEVICTFSAFMVAYKIYDNAKLRYMIK